MTPKSPTRKGFRARKDRPTPTPEIPAPEWAADIIDALMVEDRRRFEDEPALRKFTRPSVVGEFWPMVFPADMDVIVTRIPREPVSVRGRLPNPTRPVSEADRVAIEELANGVGVSILVDYDKHPSYRGPGRSGVVDIDPDHVDTLEIDPRLRRR
jgi:hypothetical protein